MFINCLSCFCFCSLLNDFVYFSKIVNYIYSLILVKPKVIYKFNELIAWYYLVQFLAKIIPNRDKIILKNSKIVSYFSNKTTFVTDCRFHIIGRIRINFQITLTTPSIWLNGYLEISRNIH